MSPQQEMLNIQMLLDFGNSMYGPGKNPTPCWKNTESYAKMFRRVNQENNWWKDVSEILENRMRELKEQ